jgi:hypothetical protein
LPLLSQRSGQRSAKNQKIQREGGKASLILYVADIANDNIIWEWDFPLFSRLFPT